MGNKGIAWALGGGVLLLALGMVSSNQPSKKFSFIPGLDDKLREPRVQKLPTSGPDDPDARKTRVRNRRGKEVSKLKVNQQALFDFFRKGDLQKLPGQMTKMMGAGSNIEERTDENGQTYVTNVPIYVPMRDDEGKEVKIFTPGSHVADKSLKYQDTKTVEKPEGSYLIDVRASTKSDKPGVMMIKLEVWPKGWHTPIYFDRFYKKDVTISEVEQRVSELVSVINSLTDEDSPIDEVLDDLYAQQKIVENRRKLKEISEDEYRLQYQAIREAKDKYLNLTGHTLADYRRMLDKETRQEKKMAEIALQPEEERGLPTTKTFESVDVTILRPEGTQEDWTVVEAREADVSKHRISKDSPMGKALTSPNNWGDMPSVGQIIEYKRPDGKLESFRIMALNKKTLEESLVKTAPAQVKLIRPANPCPKCGGETNIEFDKDTDVAWQICTTLGCGWKKELPWSMPKKGAPAATQKVERKPKLCPICKKPMSVKVVTQPVLKGRTVTGQKKVAMWQCPDYDAVTHKGRAPLESVQYTEKKGLSQAMFEKSIADALRAPLPVSEEDKRACEICQKPMHIIQSAMDKKYYYVCPDYNAETHPSVEEYR